MTVQQLVDLLPWIVPIATSVLVAVALLLYVTAAERRKKTARDLILHYLSDNDFKMMSFATIRKNIDETYSDRFLASLPAKFPKALRRATLRDDEGQLTRPGLARVAAANGGAAVESAEEEADARRVIVPVKLLLRVCDMDSLGEVRSELDRIITTAKSA
jgi:hypothetical protein